MEDDEKLTAEALRRAGEPERAAAYAERAEGRARMIADHDRRIDRIEMRLDGFQADLREIAATAQATRAEQNGMLQSIRAEVVNIASEQTRETGRREALALVAAEKARVSDRRDKWLGWVFPFAIMFGLWAAYGFVLDVIAVREKPVEHLLEKERKP